MVIIKKALGLDALRMAAVGDIHCPRYLELLQESLRKASDFELMLLAGDLVLRNDSSQMPRLLQTIRDFYKGPIIACLGNEEFDESLQAYRKFKEVLWLHDEAEVLKIGNSILGIVGSRGSLDRPTFWQRKNVRGIWETYSKRLRRIDDLLEDMKAKKPDFMVVLTHYAPTYKTLLGEKEGAWPEMGCKGFETLIAKHQPDAWIHAHGHASIQHEAFIGRTIIVNASLPARRQISILEFPRDQVASKSSYAKV
ncbi:metallophosphoesterase [Candidatus Bathyarchaeota archaeon]|nr:metallophosphoesterase [Candidatus Bathyarchaeota archaeon]